MRILKLLVKLVECTLEDARLKVAHNAEMKRKCAAKESVFTTQRVGAERERLMKQCLV